MHSGVIIDDNPSVLTAEYVREFAEPKFGKIRVTVQCVDNPL